MPNKGTVQFQGCGLAGDANTIVSDGTEGKLADERTGLRAAKGDLFDFLGAHAALIAAIGDSRIYDQAPANVAFPFITFGRTSVYDWSTGKERDNEQLFTLHIWSKAKGNQETLDIMELARARLADIALPLDNHSPVSLRLEFAEERYDEDLSVHHGLLRFRAVTSQTEKQRRPGTRQRRNSS